VTALCVPTFGLRNSPSRANFVNGLRGFPRRPHRNRHFGFFDFRNEFINGAIDSTVVFDFFIIRGRVMSFFGNLRGGGGEARGLSLPSDIVVAARAGFCIPITLTNLASPWFK
jgi:hypothetical protein